jgi:hypothetical protein
VLYLILQRVCLVVPLGLSFLELALEFFFYVFEQFVPVVAIILGERIVARYTYAHAQFFGVGGVAGLLFKVYVHRVDLLGVALEFGDGIADMLLHVVCDGNVYSLHVNLDSFEILCIIHVLSCMYFLDVGSLLSGIPMLNLNGGKALKFT